MLLNQTVSRKCRSNHWPKLRDGDGRELTNSALAVRRSTTEVAGPTSALMSEQFHKLFNGLLPNTL
ncbi:hypothetical protein DPMN_040284 [Dreissena polymorpha]|uniref:Uncharacterized protein n=1 Tax=Dreissena polymorpha TaxID=45954 RepID=A0A9D4CV02_DREPO|nr:hypothetical protein DPMN_040284 [Dreissena polymorpha]